jgi:hypothetical protein
MATVSLDVQCATLAQCGIHLRPGITIEHLLAAFERAEYEAEPYDLLLVAMGNGLEAASEEPLCDNIWHCDMEAVYGPGSYSAIARRLHDVAGGALPLDAIADEVDTDRGVARLTFQLDGRAYEWTPTVDRDWVDPDILGRFAALLASRATDKRFTYCDLHAQDCLIVCSTPTQLQLLRERTGLNFKRLGNG